MEERNRNSWQEFKNELAVLRSEHEKLRGPDDTVLLFRGSRLCECATRDRPLAFSCSLSDED
jgi:hypothetical protein